MRIISYDGNTAVGCAGFRKYDECAEVKRVFVREKYRGRGISKRLMEMLETRANKYMILESGEPLKAAMSVYRGTGYEIIPNYGQYKDMPDSVCMKNTL